MSNIEKLENEISESLKIQYLLREQLKSSIKTLEEVEKLLRGVETNLNDSNEYIVALKQENLKLKLSCAAWAKRAIKLEFKVLSTRDATKK